MEHQSATHCHRCGKKLPEGSPQDGMCQECRTASTVDGPLPAADEASTHSSSPGFTRSLPDRIGSYKILDFLGEGGMGSVYLAEQEQPIRRKVALKVVKLGMDTKEVMARFESERQALAMMNHPNIARVHDAGMTEHGAPYFVMEHVAGVSITDYCDKHRLSTRERLEIFIPVCQAIQHAHQKGIIHRDIKPSNVLVAVQDGKPVPKIIDFGVAKATNQRLTEKTLFTQQGYLIGTPEYMSPEQAEMTGLDVDTTTDIYSLGVLLYQLLVGALPFDAQTLRRAGYDEIRRMIREDEPPKPTTKLSSLGQSAKEIAERRRTDVASLAKDLRGDLEWVTLKAMEKDRTRRYASSSELAADIERHFKNEPVIACPPSAAYRMRKFVRRHRTGVGIAAASVLVLIAFAVTTAVQARRIARERDRANREANIAKQVSDFMQSLFRAPDPWEGKGKEVTAREILDEASARVATELSDQPEMQAKLTLVMSFSYYNLRVYDKAEKLAQMALAISQRVLGQESATTADALTRLGAITMFKNMDLDKAEKFTRESLNINLKLFGPDSYQVAENINDIATININRGDLAKAEQGLRESLGIYRKARGNEHDDVLTVMNNLAMVLKMEGKLEEAAPLYQEVLSIRRRIKDPNHPSVAQCLNNLAMLYVSMKKYPEAEKLLQEALTINRRVYGDSGGIANLSNLGLLNIERGHLSAAENYSRQVLEMDQKRYGDNNRYMADDLTQLGIVLTREKKFPEAEANLRKALRIALLKYAPDHWRVAVGNNSLGACLSAQKKFKEAEPLLIESYAIIKKRFGPKNERSQKAGVPLIAMYEDLGKKDKADAIRAELGITK
jgi:eukaryotic-like serine/threonine-protein kinase